MKENRHQKILEIIESRNVGTQEELADLLRGAGYNVTQATVSRDIRELALSKIPGENGAQKYVCLPRSTSQMSDKFIRVLHDGFVSMEQAQNLLVVRTVSGMAMAVAAALDAMHFREVIGCIAGDDTIFIASHTNEETAQLAERLRTMLSQS